MESKNKSSSSSCSNPKKKKKRSQAIAFGRAYFHALGGTTPALVVPKNNAAADDDDSSNNNNDDNSDKGASISRRTIMLQQEEERKKNHTLICYQWKYPPWMKPDSKQTVSNTNSSHENAEDDNNNDDKDDDDDDDDSAINHDDPLAIIQQAVATSQSTLFLTQAGKVYQTGTLHGHQYTHPTLITIAMPLKCVEIAAGRHFCLARMQDGLAVLSWGAGHFGQLGVQSPATNNSDDDDDDDDDDEDDPNSRSAAASERQITFTSRPILIEGLLPRAVGSPIQQIAAGDWHGMALTESGRVFCWGSNRSQQCGRKPPKSSNGSNGGANPAPTILTPAPVPFPNESASTTTSTPSDWLRVAKIAAGRSHSVALARETGQVYCWGSTLYGQCGNFVRRTPIVPPRRVEGLQDLNMVQIAAAGCHTLALTSGGRVFGWGQCHEGQLGVAMPNITSNNNNNNNGSTDYSGMTAAITVTAAAPRPRLVADLDFVAIAAGQEWKTQQKTQQRRLDKETTNVNANSSTNNDNNFDNTAPIATGNDHKVDPSSSLSSPSPPGTLNSAAAATTTTTSPTTDTLTSQLSTIPRITQIYAGAFYSVAVSSSGHVYTFGSNDAGQLGVPTPRNLPFRETGQPHKASIADASSTATTVAAVTPSTVRELNVQSFDSRHLVLLPVRVEAAMSINVRTVACGPNHLWCIGEERDDSDGSANVIGRTQYEVQEGHRRQTLVRARAHRQQQYHQRQQEQPNGFASSGVMLLPTTQSKPPPTLNHEEDEAKAWNAITSSLPNLEVRPSPFVDFLSPHDLTSPATTTTTAAADGLLTPSTDGVGEEEEESTTLSSSPVVGSALTSTALTAPNNTTNKISAASGRVIANNASSSSSPPTSPHRNVKRTRSRGIIRRLSSGIRKRLGGKTKQEGGQLPLDTESERGHHHRRSRNHQTNNSVVAAEMNEGGGGGTARTRWRKRNTIG